MKTTELGQFDRLATSSRGAWHSI